MMVFNRALPMPGTTCKCSAHICCSVVISRILVIFSSYTEYVVTLSTPAPARSLARCADNQPALPLMVPRRRLQWRNKDANSRPFRSNRQCT